LVHAVGQAAEEPVHTKGAQEGLPAEPAETGEQVPTLPARSQASQAPPHAVLQQTPSTQLPEAQALAAEQAPPLVFLGTQAPASQ
jgi:hypothetical protein